jgi:hypothetical protein
MHEDLTCERCGGETEVGYLLDHSYAAKLPAQWVPGEPQRNWWHGLKVPATYEVRTVRCLRCGRLEFFAGPA